MTVSSSVFTTHTSSALTASEAGAFPTPIERVTSFVSGSTRTTLFEPASPTHTLPNPTAIPRGSSPTGISATAFVSGSIREIVPSNRLVTDTLPSPTATPAGPFPTSISFTTSCVARLTRDTEGPPLFTTQRASSPTAIPVGFSPTGMESRISCSFESICVTLPVSGCGHPKGAPDVATDPGRVGSGTVVLTSLVSGSSTPTRVRRDSRQVRSTRSDQGDRRSGDKRRSERRDRDSASLTTSAVSVSGCDVDPGDSTTAWEHCPR